MHWSRRTVYDKVMRRRAAVLASIPALVLAGGLAWSAGVPGALRFARLNRGYSGIAPTLAPIEQGPVTIRLSSPRNDLTLRDNSLRLEPGAGGSNSAELRLEFSGKGWLVADVEMGGVSSRLQDEVVVPPQVLEMQGRVRVRKVRGGYEVTPEQLPRQVSVRIQSGLGQQLVELCDGASALLTELDCPGLQRSLSRAVVPLPAPGETFMLADSDLSPEERQQLEAYLSDAAGSSR
jgi:hypothetical protein